LIGSGPLLDAGEQVELSVTLSDLVLPPGEGTVFTLRFQSATGAEVYLQKATPADLPEVVELTSSSGSVPPPTNNTLEFDAVKGKTPRIFPISGIMYAIVYAGDTDVGYLKTYTLAPNGRIIKTANDSLTLDSVKGKEPDMISISGNVYAIAYSGAGADGFLKTVTIAADGQITDTVIDTLEFDPVKGKIPNIIPISGDVYAIAYAGDSDVGFLITDTVIDTLEFDTVKGKTANIIPISGNVYAIAYAGDGDDGFLKTVTIATNGQITDTVIDTLEFDPVKGKTPNIIPISGDVYAISYAGDTDDGFLITVTIATDGQITDTVIDTLEFDTVKGKDANIIPISGDVYAIAYSGDTDDGFLKSIEIRTSGQIP